MAEKDVITKNLNEFLEIAGFSFKEKKYNVAVTLYYKSLVELCDLELLNKLGKLGANHTDRFNNLKSISPELYKIASKLFRFYRDSYNKEISFTIAKIVRDEVKKCLKIYLKK